jgi:hypothetical protein
VTKLTPEQVIERAQDTTNETTTITKLVDEDGSWEINCGMRGMWRSKAEFPVAPKVGDLITTYGGIGRPIKGIDLNGIPCWYKTQAEMDEEHRLWVEELHRKRLQEFEESKDKLDAQYAVLPKVFQRRIDKFRAANPEFRVDYEAYELFCCSEAVKFAERARNAVLSGEYDEEMCAFYANPAQLKLAAYGSGEVALREPQDPYWRWLVWAESLNSKAYDYDYKRCEEVLGVSDGHSGNTFGCALNLAILYLNEPEFVVKQHGALAVLVGCEKYGCPHEEQ